MWECPICRYKNDNATLECPCGYDLRTRIENTNQKQPQYSLKKRKIVNKAGNFLILLSIVLFVAFFVLLMISPKPQSQMELIAELPSGPKQYTGRGGEYVQKYTRTYKVHTKLSSGQKIAIGGAPISILLFTVGAILKSRFKKVQK
jgi:hypothetical protein